MTGAEDHVGGEARSQGEGAGPPKSLAIHSRRTSSTQLRFLGLSSMASMSSKRQKSSTKHVCQHSGEETEGRSHTTSQSVDEGPGVAEARDAGLVNCEYNCRACRVGRRWHTRAGGRARAASSISRSRKPTSVIEQASLREHCLVLCWSSVGSPGSQQTRGVFKGRLYDLSSPDDKSCKHCA